MPVSWELPPAVKSHRFVIAHDTTGQMVHTYFGISERERRLCNVRLATLLKPGDPLTIKGVNRPFDPDFDYTQEAA